MGDDLQPANPSMYCLAHPLLQRLRMSPRIERNPSAGIAPSENVENEAQAPRTEESAKPAPAANRVSAYPGRSEAVSLAREALNRSYLDPVVTDADAQKAAGALQKLSGETLRQALKDLVADGSMDRLFEELTPSDRNALLEHCVGAGVLTKEPGEKSSGRFAPPDGPEMIAHDCAWPRSMLNAIHSYNAGQAFTYASAYKEYVERYSDAVDEVKTGAEMRALGEPVRPHALSEPVDFHDPLRSQYSIHLPHRPSALDTQPAIDRALNRFRHERNHGVFADVKADVKTSVGEASAKYSTGFNGAQGLDGSYAVKPKVTVEGVEMSIGSKKFDVKVEEVIDLGIGRTVSGELSRFKVKSPALETGIEFDNEKRKLKIETPSGRVGFEDSRFVVGMTAAKVAGAKAEVLFFYDVEKGEIGGGVGTDLKWKGQRLQSEFVGGIPLVSPGRAQQATAHLQGYREGPFDQPAERAAGKAWAELPPARREFLSRLGWNEADWQSTTGTQTAE
jgi:hypothetical protein